MALADNTEKIRGLLEVIDTLPQVGGGGGRLPDGIIKLATGTFTPVTNIGEYDSWIEYVQIWHTLGVEPNYMYVYDTFDYSETHGVNAVVSITLNCKELKAEGSTTIYCPGWEFKYYRSEGWVDMCGFDYEKGYDYSYDINENYVNLYCANGQDYGYFHAGHTYRWIAGVIDGIN